jgi:hypothetical protein
MGMRCAAAIFFGVAIVGTLTQPTATTAAERELLRDNHFQRGFLLLAPQPGKRVVSGELAGVDHTGKPAWDLAQWSSKHPLPPAPPDLLPEGVARYENRGKTVIIGPASTERADLTLAVHAGAEYARPREVGEPWTHLLAQQRLDNPPGVAELSACRLHIESRLNHSRLIVEEGYSPSRHAAQFQIFLTIANRNPASAGFGKYLWFGAPLYDNRERMVSGHQAQDTGDTKMFIYTLATADLTRDSAHDGQWVTIDADLLPHIRRGLEHAWSRGFLTESRDFADYGLDGVAMGWEVPGMFDVEVQVRNFSLKATDRR